MIVVIADVAAPVRRRFAATWIVPASMLLLAIAAWQPVEPLV